MTLKQQILDDIDDVFFDEDEFAETASYAPKNGDPAFSVLVIPTQGDSLNSSGLSASSKAQVYLKESEVSQPVYLDKITIAGFVWTVERDIENAGGVWVVTLRRGEKSVFK